MGDIRRNNLVLVRLEQKKFVQRTKARVLFLITYANTRKETVIVRPFREMDSDPGLTILIISTTLPRQYSDQRL